MSKSIVLKKIYVYIHHISQKMDYGYVGEL